MKHYKWIIAFTFLFLFIGQTVSLASSEEERDDKQMIDEISLEGVQAYWNELVQEYQGYLPELEKNTVYDFIKEEKTFSFKHTLTGLIRFLFHEFTLNAKLLGQLLILTLFSVLLQTIHTSFERSAVSKIAYFIVYIVLLFISLNSFYLTSEYISNAIGMMTNFMIALIPLVLGIMSTFGNLASVSFFHPIIIFLINFSGLLVSKFIMPLLLLSALLEIVSTLNEKHRVTHLANMIRSISVGSLGVFLTVFLGVMSIQGAAGAIQDGVAMKTTKFITGNFIPVVGRTFTDAADTVLSASLLLKNAVGIIGVAIIIFIAIFPALKVLAIALIYKLAAAILQPLADGPIITCLNSIGQYLLYMLACLLTVSLMFFLAIVVIVVSGNITLFLR